MAATLQEPMETESVDTVVGILTLRSNDVSIFRSQPNGCFWRSHITNQKQFSNKSAGGTECGSHNFCELPMVAPSSPNSKRTRISSTPLSNS